MRALNCRTEADDKFISGIAVPWNEEITYRGEPESFSPGGLAPASNKKMPLRYGHRDQVIGAHPIPIGEIVHTVDTAEGLWVECRMMDTSTAAEAWLAAQAGLVTGFSVEFHVPGQRIGPAQGRGIKAGILDAVALTERPAYRSAAVANVRERTPRLDDHLEWLKSLDAEN